MLSESASVLKEVLVLNDDTGLSVQDDVHVVAFVTVFEDPIVLFKELEACRGHNLGENFVIQILASKEFDLLYSHLYLFNVCLGSLLARFGQHSDLRLNCEREQTKVWNAVHILINMLLMYLILVYCSTRRLMSWLQISLMAVLVWLDILVFGCFVVCSNLRRLLLDVGV